MPNIPTKLHFIWVGNPLPANYVANLLSWVIGNPFYDVSLWTESKMLDETIEKVITYYDAEHREPEHGPAQIITTFSGKMISIDAGDSMPLQVQINNLSTLTPLSDPMLLQEELTTWRNYGTSSSILRCWILYQEGGVYMDFDVYPLGSLPAVLPAPKGILFGEVAMFTSNVLVNALIAAPAKSDHVVAISKRLEETYEETYEEIAPGVRKITPEEIDRLNTIERLRNASTASYSPGASRRLLLWDSLISPALQRSRTFFHAVDSRMPVDEVVAEYSFQRNTGAKIQIQHHGAWHV